jgi:hypothetical protein
MREEEEGGGEAPDGCRDASFECARRSVARDIQAAVNDRHLCKVFSFSWSF